MRNRTTISACLAACVTLAACSGGADTGDIPVDDNAVVSLQNAPAVDESQLGAALNFGIALSSPIDVDVSVTYQTNGGTATPGDDFVAQSATVVIAAGLSSATVAVPVISDTLDEPDETVVLEVVAVSVGSMGTATATGTIMDDDPPVSISAGNASVTEGDNGQATLSFPLTLSSVSGLDVAVDYATANGTATAGSDYVAASGTATIPAGSQSTTVSVSVNGDAVDEGNETVLLQLSGAGNATIAAASGTGTIVDDDDPNIPPGLSVSVADAGSVGEGGTATFVFTLSDVAGLGVSVDYQTVSGTATAGSDFSAASGTLVIPAGSLSGSVNVATTDDGTDEPNETFQMQITGVSAGSIGTATGTAVITDNDAVPTLSIAGTALTEGDAGQQPLNFSVTLSAASGQVVTVDYSTSDGTATAGEDYTATGGTLTFPAGSTQQSVSVPVLGDTFSEPDETFDVALSNARNATIATGAATGTIQNDDAVPGINIVAGATVTEGDSGQVNLVFTLRLTLAAGDDVTVDYATADGTATAGDDYTATSGTATVTAGNLETTVSVPVLGDTLGESDETVTLNLSNASGANIGVGSRTGTIQNDDPLPALSVATPAAVPEGDAGSADLVFTISLDAAGGADVTVDFTTVSGTASAGSDFVAGSGTATIASGDTQTTVAVSVLGDTLFEANEDFELQLSNAVDATIATAAATGNITNDDAAPVIGFAQDEQRAEGDSGSANLVFTVALNVASGLDAEVDYATSDGTASAGTDYGAVTGTATVPAGGLQATISVPVFGDTLDENDETFTVTLSNAADATLGDAQATGTITDDDAPPALSVADTSGDEGDSGQAARVFTISLDRASSFVVQVNYATADGSATAGEDYVAASGTATIAAGALSTTVSVDINGDTDEESDESFTLTLSNPQNATISDGSATGTIADDDTVAQSGLASRPSNTSCLAGDPPSNNAAIAQERAFSGIGGLVKPVQLIQAPGDTAYWYVVEQDGRIRRFQNTPAASSFETFIDIRSPSDPIDVDSEATEAGLFSMAFHPDYGNGNWDVYLSYTVDGPSSGLPLISKITKFESTDNGQTLDPTTAVELISMEQWRNNHNGGHLAFGADGYLYIHFGDGGSANDPQQRAQDTENLFGSMLRIDVDSAASPYGIPGDNPFAGNNLCSDGYGSEDCAEIYAWGLRNAWRWSFDDATGQLWLADVGQDRYEEVDIIERGGNYGWNCREGAHSNSSNGPCPAPSMIDPIIEYPHAVGNSITGGVVYRGSAIPELSGRYVFGDFAVGKLFASVDNGDGTYDYELLATPGHNISSFAIEPSGEVLYLNYGGGNIRRIIQAGGSSSGSVATLLSDTGCVDSGDPTQPASGMIPYDINVPFWSDGATKGRWYSIPDGTTIDVNADGDWIFPNGTVLMKSFTLGSQLIETRLFMRHSDGEWAGYTYEWDGAETDATRVVGGKVRDVSGQDWIYPSEAECLQCHTAVANHSLGIEHGQLNKDLTYPSTGITANQIYTADFIDVLTDDLNPGEPESLESYPDPTDTGETLEARARAYLHSNCSGCHRPSGPTPSDMDLRYATSLNQTNTCNVLPSGDDLGIPNARIITPGDAAASLIVERPNRRDTHGMPPVGSNIAHAEGVQLLADWVNAMSGCP